MEELLTGNVWKQIAGKVKQKGRRFAAIAYVSAAGYLKLREKDVLVCDASDEVIKSRGTSPAALSTYLEDGVELYHQPGLHAKVVVFGKHALIGSCNLSSFSANRLLEAALLSSRLSVRSQALAFVQSALKKAEPIDKAFIKRIQKIKLSERPFIPTPAKTRTVKSFGTRFWVISTSPMKRDDQPGEERIIAQGEKQAEKLRSDKASEVDWVRWSLKDRFRELASPGDTIIEIHHSSKARIQVWPPMSILLKQRRQTFTRFYFEVPGDADYLPWGVFEKQLRSVGIRNIKKNSRKELSPRNRALVEAVWADRS